MENERAGMTLIAVCREINKDTGQIAVYPIDKPLDDFDLQCLKIRETMNPELRYFATTKAHFEGFGDIITATLKKRNLTESDIARVGGIVAI